MALIYRSHAVFGIPQAVKFAPKRSRGMMSFQQIQLSAELSRLLAVLTAETPKVTGKEKQRIARSAHARWMANHASPPEENETFDTRTEAVLAAVQVAEIKNLEVVVHANDGTIQKIVGNSADNLAA